MKEEVLEVQISLQGHIMCNIVISQAYNSIIQSLKPTHQILDIYIGGFREYDSNNKLQKLV